MTQRPLRALLVDPSLFTAPYDAALTQGLLSAGVEPTWAVRPTRPGDREEIPRRHTDPFFYRWVERATWVPTRLRALFKGAAHALGLARLFGRCVVLRPDVVHFQWVVLPLLDTLAIAVLRLLAPVILTVHDTVPFNGQRISFWQSFGFDAPMRLADRVITHTQAGRKALLARGVPDHKVAVIAHGPLALPVAPSAHVLAKARARYTFVLFGEIKPYKGCEVLIEALGLLPALLRDQARVVIAGRPRMDLSALRERIHELGLTAMVEVRPQRLSEQEMADLFAEADCFLLPYLQIDASGVYFLVKSLGKWLIASRVGVFAEDLQENAQGWLVPPGSPAPLAVALAQAIVDRPAAQAVETGAAWSAIGLETSALYQRAMLEREVGARAEEIEG